MEFPRSLPYSPDAERAVLEHCFSRPNDVGDVLTQIPDGAFYHAGNRLLYESIGHMVGDGCPIEYRAASQWLQERGLLDKVGGAGEFSAIALSVGVANWGHYRDILLDKWKAREIIEACTDAMLKTYEQPANGSVDDWLGELTDRIVNLSQDRQQRKGRSMRVLVEAAMERFEAALRRGGALPGISTGFPGLDRVTCGKLPGQLWVIGGGTSDGKSAYAQQVALFIAEAGIPVAIYTLEMSDDDVIDRCFAMHSGVDSTVFRQGAMNPFELKKTKESVAVLSKLPLTIRDVSGIKLAALVADMRLLAKKGVRHFVVDYGQLIESEARSRSREEEVARISRTLKATAKQLQVSIDLLSQLNDDGKLRESRAIGFDADVVLTISCPIIKEKRDGEWIETRQEDKRIVMVGKNRNGKRGTPFQMKFNGATFTFIEQAGSDEK